MVVRSCTLIATAVVGLTSSLAAKSADAQIVVGRGGGGISIGIPGVGGIRLGAPLRYRGVSPYGVSPYGYGYNGLDYYSSPYYGRTTRYVARPITSGRYAALQSLPTAGELRAMNDSELLNAIVSLQAQLDYELERYDTAATWQNYLRLSEDALPPASDDGRVMLGTDSIAESLKRFQLTVANPRYVQISGLPSFAAMHAALSELAARMGTAPSVASDVETDSNVDRVVPPAKPSPPQPSSITASPRDSYEPRSIEMRNLHAGPAYEGSAQTSAGERADRDQVNAQPASTSSEAEQLPAPPPSLVAPQNETAEEHSILSR